MNAKEEEKQAKALERLMGQPDWQVFVDMALDLRNQWVNELVKADSPETRAKILALDSFIQEPSVLVAEYQEVRKLKRQGTV